MTSSFAFWLAQMVSGSTVLFAASVSLTLSHSSTTRRHIYDAVCPTDLSYWIEYPLGTCDYLILISEKWRSLVALATVSAQ